MEHLVFEADEPRETASACREIILKEDWEPFDSLIDFLPHKTPWLGFDHDTVPLGIFAEYQDNAGFNHSELWNANFRESHPVFQELSDIGIGERVAAFFQAWLYYALLESMEGKKIYISYLMQYEIDGKGYLYSRNLHFCLQAKVFEIRANPERKLETSTAMQLDLRLVKKWLARFTAWSHPSFRPKRDKEYPAFMDQLEVVILAIVRLAEAVERTRFYALPDCPNMGTLALPYPYKMADSRRSKLRGLGRCPFQIRLLEDTALLGLSRGYYHVILKWNSYCQGFFIHCDIHVNDMRVS